MKVIPLQAVPSQSVDTILGGQNCKVNIYQLSTGLFFDLYLNDLPIIVGRICRDRCKLVRYAYLGFTGDLTFVDAQGLSDPEYSGIGTRYVLVYIEDGDSF